MADADLLREEYIRRINRVLDHIDQNLAGPLPLKALADIAHFSPFHFHRLFHAMLGETAGQYIQRLRLEKAASQLRMDTRRSVTDVALGCGFSSSAAFARAFRNAFGTSATEWRYAGSSDGDAKSKIGKEQGKQGKERAGLPAYVADAFRHQQRKSIMTQQQDINVRVEDMEEMTVAYVRHIGAYQGNSELFGELFGRLFAWAGPRQLVRFPETKILSLYYSDPDVTDDDKLRVDVALTVPAGTEVSGEVGIRDIPAGRYAVGRFETTSDDFGSSWDAMYKQWLPTSGYLPDDRPCFELYHNDHREHPEGKHIYDICIPVTPMG